MSDQLSKHDGQGIVPCVGIVTLFPETSSYCRALFLHNSPLVGNRLCCPDIPNKLLDCALQLATPYNVGGVCVVDLRELIVVVGIVRANYAYYRGDLSTVEADMRSTEWREILLLIIGGGYSQCRLQLSGH